MISKTHQCHFCEEVLETYAQFNSHLNKHVEEKRFQCPDRNCHQLFSKIETYLKHTKENHGIKPKFACSKCDKVFDRKNRLSFHEYAHTLKIENAGTTANDELNGANYQNTQDVQSSQCFKCKSSFVCQKSFDKHMSFVNHDAKCPICYKIFQSDMTVRKHIKTQHLNSNCENIKCNVCGKTFKSAFYLKSHLLIHTGDLPFGCDKCNAKFNRKDKLKRHSLCHETEKKFSCPFRENAKCKKQFYRMDKLKSHIKTHGNVKRTKCLHCRQTFGNSTTLRKHVAESHHSSIKQIKCFECDETFKREKQRRIHHEKHHGIIHYIDGTSFRTLPFPLKIKNTHINKGYDEESHQENIVIYIGADKRM